MKLIFCYLIFPGFLFAACIGLISGWIDRKLTARIQWRVGPPWHQNFTDIMKLFFKETMMPENARFTFLLSPYFGLLSLVLATTILGMNALSPATGFAGDLIVVLYLLMIPAIAVIIGASSSRNVLASMGASREMKLALGYELPFLLSIITVIVKSGGIINIGGILSRQAHLGANMASWSGALAFIAAVFCMQAKLCIGLFDISEADQELMGGTLIEYSGLPLAIFKLTKAVLLYTMPLFLIIMFWGNDLRPVILIGKYLALLLVIILVKNTNPRLRIDQALRFFWGPMTVLAGAGIILAVFGL